MAVRGPRLHLTDRDAIQGAGIGALSNTHVEAGPQSDDGRAVGVETNDAIVVTQGSQATRTAGSEYLGIRRLTPLVCAHEVLASQDRMLLVPDDRLGEVKLLRLEHRWIVGAVRIAAPNVESPSRQQHPRQVPEPGIEQLLKCLIGNEIVGERPVLGPQLLQRRFGFLGVACEVQTLVMLGSLE